MDKPICIDISLQTPENDQMVLEIWKLSVSFDNCDNTNSLIYPTIYERMSVSIEVNFFSITIVY